MHRRQLRHFLALVDHGSFVRAAEAVHLSQPALSRSIRAFEDRVGHTLFERDTAGVRLTPQGRVLETHVRELLRGMDAAIAALEGSEAEAPVRIRLGSGPGPAANLVPAAIGAFLSGHPRVRIDYEVLPPTRLVSALREQRLDLVVADLRYFEGHGEFVIEPLRERRGVLFCRWGHPLLTRSPVRAADLHGLPLVSMHLRNTSGIPTPDQFGRPVDLACDTLETLSAVVGNSDAVGLAPEEALEAPLAAGRIAILPFDATGLPPETMRVRYGLIHLRSQPLLPAVQALVAQLRQIDARAPVPAATMVSWLRIAV